MDEFSLIAKYFTALTPQGNDVALGIGDDAALVIPPFGKQLAISTDSLVAGVHFLMDWPARSIGHRALAVNLSDLAAMGAKPLWSLMALTLPEIDEVWLQQFCAGFATLAQQYAVSLIGGNIARGPLNITLTVVGEVAPQQVLRRDAAEVGDLIYVTGPLGGAALAVRYLTAPSSLSATEHQELFNTLLYPQPRVAHGAALLADHAHAAIDLSDGLAADLSHVLHASHVGATLYLQQLPIHPIVVKNLSAKAAWELALSGGDDYELCFTVPPSQVAAVEAALNSQQLPFFRIGVCEAQPGLRCVTPQGQLLSLDHRGFQHFE